MDQTPAPQPEPPIPAQESPRERDQRLFVAAGHILAAGLLQYPSDRLTPEMIAELRARVFSDLMTSDALRSVPLKNSDEPVPVFKAWRGR